MTPYDVKILIHCYCNTDPLPDPGVPALDGALNKMEAEGLLHQTKGGKWKTTPRGDAHMRQICNLPFPTQVWIGSDGKAIDV